MENDELARARSPIHRAPSNPPHDSFKIQDAISWRILLLLLPLFTSGFQSNMAVDASNPFSERPKKTSFCS
jgi:hypothetical protein